MSHVRTQVKEAIATILKTSPVTWGSVHKSRIQSPRQIWPYVMVFTTGETDEALTPMDPQIYSRTISLSIIGMLRMPSNNDKETIEDKMDALALEVETKLTNQTLRAVLPAIESILLTSTSLDVIVTDDDIIDHAEVTISYEVVCATNESSPDVLL